jgi:hypothetical protein
VAATLWLALLIAWSTSTLFLVLGLGLLGRPATSEGPRLANVLFAVWWIGLAASNAITGMRILLVALDMPLTLFVGLQFVNAAAVTMGLAGLLYYLLFLFTGRSFLLWPLVVFYALFCGWIIRSTGTWSPVGVEVSATGAALLYEHPIDGTFRLLALLALVGPQLVAVAALFALATRLPPSASRVRLLTVAGAIALWFGAVFALPVTGDATVAQVARLLVTLVAGALVLAVHYPPSWLRERLPPEIPVSAPREAA